MAERKRGIRKPLKKSRKKLNFKLTNMKQNQNLNKKKLMLIKERIATLSGDQLQNIIGGAGTIGGPTHSTQQHLTCTWCTYTSGTPKTQL